MHRRAALSGLVAPVLALRRAFRGLEDAEAKKRKRKKKCRGNKRKCGKKCIPQTACCGGCGDRLCCDGACADCCDETACPLGAACIDGSCACFAEDVVCGEICVDLTGAVAHCGACGVVCPVPACIHGACLCTTGTDCPNESCVCADRNEGGKACSRGTTEQTCATDDECQVGSFCTADVSPRCSVPCLG